MGMYKPIKLTVDGYKITMSDSIDLYVGDRVTLQFELYKLAVATRFGAATRTTDIQPLTAILYIETPDGRDVMEAADIIDNLVEFNLSEEYTQNIGVSRLQLRLFDDNGDRITLPEFTFNVKESIYGDQVTKINLCLADENRNAVADENGNRIATPTRALNVAVNKQIQSFEEKKVYDGGEDILIQDSGITKRIKVDSLLAQTNAQLSEIEIMKGAISNSVIYLEEVYARLEKNNKTWDDAFAIAISKIADASSSDDAIGGTIILPAYKIKLKKQITIPACAVEIKGTFMKSVMEFYDCVDEYAFYVDGLAYESDGETVKRKYAWLNLTDVVLNGRKKREGFKPITAIYLKGHELHDANVNDCQISNCKFFHWDTCVAGTLAWDNQFNNCRFHDGVLACDFKYQFQMNSFNDCKFSSFEQGFKFNNIDLQEFRTCDIVNVNKLIVSAYQSHMIFEGCYLEHLPDFGEIGATNESFASSLIFKNCKVLGSNKKIPIAFKSNKMGSVFIVDDSYVPHGIEITYKDSPSVLYNSYVNNIWFDNGYNSDGKTTREFYQTKTIYKFQFNPNLSAQDNIANFKSNFPANQINSLYDVVVNDGDDFLTVTVDKWQGLKLRDFVVGKNYTVLFEMRSDNAWKTNTIINTTLPLPKTSQNWEKQALVWCAGMSNTSDGDKISMSIYNDRESNSIQIKSIELIEGICLKK